MADLPLIKQRCATGEGVAAYNAWFCTKVEQAVASTKPGIPHDEGMAKMRAIIERELYTRA